MVAFMEKFSTLNPGVTKNFTIQEELKQLKVSEPANQIRPCSIHKITFVLKGGKVL